MPIKGKANLGENFYPKLVQISSEVGMKPEDLLAVMISESGLNPSAYEAKGKASGLIGFMPDTIKGLGFHGTWNDFTNLTGEQQLDYVKEFVDNKKSLMGGKPFTSAGQYYVANLWPIALKLPGIKNGDPNTRILEDRPTTDSTGEYSKKYSDIGYKISPKFESKAYRANTLFDHSKKGYITYGDMIEQTEMNKRNPIYQKAITDMRESTGYSPSSRPSSTMVAQRETSPSPLSSLENILEKYMKMLTASSTTTNSLKRLYKENLINNNILIKVIATDHVDAIEFSRVLCATLDEELLSDSYPHTDGNLVEVECIIAGPEKECLEAVAQITQAVSESFTRATEKIGGIVITANYFTNKKSSYYPISPKTADTNYRKFLLKFI